MTGKAKSNNESFEGFQLKNNAKFENFMNQNSNIDHGQFFTTAPPSLKSLSSFLNLGLGGVIGSVVGYNASIVQIVDDAIDIGRDSGKLASHIIVQAETGTTDTLDTIKNFVWQYEDITIQADIGDTITISTGGTSGSDIFLGNGVTSVTLNSTEQMRLRYDIRSNRWTIFLGAGTGGGGVSFPIRPPVDNRGTVSTNQAFTLSSTTGHVLKFIAAGDFDVTFSAFPVNDIQQEWEVEVIQDATGGRVVSFPQVLASPVIDLTPDSTTVVTLRTNDGGSTILVGNTIDVQGGGDLSQWATFTAVQDIDYGTFDGINIDRLLFDQATGESLTATDIGITSDATGNLNFNSLDEYNFEIDGNSAVKFEDVGGGVLQLDMLNHTINDAKDYRLDAAASFSGSGAQPTIGYDLGDLTFLFNAPDANFFSWTFNNTERMRLSDGNLIFADGTLVIFNPDATNAGVNAGLVVGDPSATTNADLWYNSTTNKLRTKENGVNIDVVGGTGSQTPWLSDIDGDGKFLQDAGGIELRDDVTLPGNTVNFIAKQLVNLVYNSNTTDGHLFTIAGTQKFGIGVNINNSLNVLSMNSNKITDLSDPTVNQDAVTKFYHDNTPVNTGIQDGELWESQAHTVLDVWLANSKTGATTTSLTLINNTLVYIPFYLGKRIRVSQLAIEIKSASIINPSINFALYDSYPLENYPRTRLATANDLPGASFVGVVDTSNDIIEDVEAGLYWIGISTDVTIPGIAAFLQGDMVSVGYQRNTAGNDSFENVLTFQAVGTVFPATAASNMTAATGSVSHAGFMETTFNPN